MRKGERELKKQRQYKPRGEKQMVITGGKFDFSLRGVYIVNN